MNTESPLQDIETLDTDGALRETAHDAGLAGRLTRRGAIATGGAATAALAFTGTAAATSTGSAGDLKILNFALTLEYLEATFYSEAVHGGALSGDTKTFAKVVASHEATHVKTLTSVIKSLGGKPVAKPTFNFKGATGTQTVFQKTALKLESTGVSAYLGQGANVKSNAILGEALAILAVEARHQAWIADIIGMGGNPSPSPSPFATPLSMSAVLAAVKQTGFITKS